MITYIDVANETCLTSQNDTLSQSCTSRNADLGYNHGVFTNDHIVGHLHQIVDFYTLLYPGFINGAPVYGSVGSHFNVIVYLHKAYLGDLYIFLCRPGKTKSVTSDNDTGMQDDPLSDDASSVIQRRWDKEWSLHR